MLRAPRSQVCSFSLTANLFFCFILKVGVLSEAVDGMVPAVVAAQYSLDAGVVSVLLMVTIVSALALAVGLAVHQIGVAARHPVIRLQETQAAPELPLALGHFWHLFLSHVWGTGQDQCATIKRQLCLLMPDVSIFLDVDDLANTADLETNVDASAVVLIFVSTGCVCPPPVVT